MSAVGAIHGAGFGRGTGDGTGGTWIKSIEAPELPSTGFGVDRTTSGTYTFQPPDMILLTPYERSGPALFNIPFEGTAVGTGLDLLDPRGGIPDGGLETLYRKR